MGQRNMVYTGPMLETEHGHLPYGPIPSFVQPSNNHTILPPPGNRTSFNPQHMPENHGHMPHTITQYNNVFMAPAPAARVFPVAINHGIQDQLPIPNIHGSFERNDGQFIDGVNNGFKRKNTERFVGNGNVQYFYPAPGSSSSVAIPMNTEGSMMEAAAQRRGSGAIGVDPVMAHSSSHLIPGNYGAFPWNHAPGIPYIQGGMEAANVGLHGYQVAASNRNSAAFVHPPPPIMPRHPPPPPMPPMQGHNMEFHPQLASTSRRLPTNGAIIPFQNGMETGPGPRFVAPTLPTGLRVYRPHRREHMVDTTARHHSFPHLRVLPEDGVAILDISGYHEVGHSVDHHSDMRLDIDHMSYEELLELGEQIGSVGSGLSDDFILQHLKTRVFASSKSSSDLEDASSADQELNSCVICQTNFDDEEQTGVLGCGHEYHVECVKKWLTVKNTCPVCKSTALAAEANDS